MSGIRILTPVTITDARLISSSVAEDDYSAWAAATAYVVGNRVIRTSVHKVYQRLVAGTTATAPELDTVNWIEVGPTNRWKMFDGVNNSATTSSTTLSVVLAPGSLIAGIAALGVVGKSIRFRISHPTLGIVYDQTRGLDGVITLPDWFYYFTDTVSPFSQFIALDLIAYSPDSQVWVDIEPLNGVASCATLVTGAQALFGQGIEYGAKVGITDYSRKTTNDFGDTVLVKRNFAKRAEITLWMPRASTDPLVAKLTALRATPALYSVSDLYEATNIFGFYKDFSVVLSYPDTDVLSLQIEGLT